MGASASLLWYRNDLRLSDHAALAAAIADGGPVVPVYIWHPAAEGEWALGAASRWWLHHSLAALAHQLERVGSRLIIRVGEPSAELAKLARETGARTVHGSRRYEPAAIESDERVMDALGDAGVRVRLHAGALLHDPLAIRTHGGMAYRVFTPFWRAVGEKLHVEPAIPEPAHVPAPAAWPVSAPLAKLGLLPKTAWDGGLRATWTPGESGALARVRAFVDQPITAYAEARDVPSELGTSMLSPHLHFGEVSVRQVWGAVAARQHEPGLGAAHKASIAKFAAEIGWREFAHHVLANYPRTAEEPLRPEFAAFPWDSNPAALRAWQQGRTGYPLVDAGMRQLWATGWMHNRMRMVVASFLVKHLLIDWREGARWFWHTLVDANLANNTLGWQWAGGCGADAAPYFRVFNPVLQAHKFDPLARYIRQWVPELAHVPVPVVHAPWLAPKEVLRGAGVELGSTYPAPIVNHAFARARALSALTTVTSGRAAAAERTSVR